MALAADAFPDAGLGHLSRSSAVAVALRARGVEVDPLAIGASAPVDRDGVAWRPVESIDRIDAPAVLVDSYRTPREVLERLAAATRLAVMDDDGDPPAGAALVVDAAADLSHACLRPAFWGLPPRPTRARVERVVVTTGGGDPGGRGAALAGSARDQLPGAQVLLVRGPQAPDEAPEGVDVVRSPPVLLDLLLDADLVVSGGGQTMLEAAACGAPCVAVPLAANQERQVNALVRVGAVSTDLSGLAALAAGATARADMAAAAQRAVDGYGALRVAFALERLTTASSPAG